MQLIALLLGLLGLASGLSFFARRADSPQKQLERIQQALFKLQEKLQTADNLNQVWRIKPLQDAIAKLEYEKALIERRLVPHR